MMNVEIVEGCMHGTHCVIGPLQVAVPRFAVGIVIGRNGEMIKKIQNDAGVRIQFKAGLVTLVSTYIHTYMQRERCTQTVVDIAICE